jgi:hypothetical protein
VTWVFFRAPDLTTSMEIISRIMTWEGGTDAVLRSVPGERVLVLVSTLLLIDVWQYKRKDHAFMVSWHWIPRALGYAALIILTLTLGNITDEVPFIYFQF